MPINSYKDRETIFDHYFGINKHVLYIPSCFDTLDEIEGNSNKYREVIYDNHSNNEYVDLYSFQVNPHEKIPNTYEDEERFNSEIIPTNPHSQVENYLHDFDIQKNIPIYDSYHDQALIHIHGHNSLSNSQVGIDNHSNFIILAKSCEKEIIPKQSQLCCNISCTISDFNLFLFPRLFCLKSNLTSNFILQIFDTLH